jgi:hypothetical protein
MSSLYSSSSLSLSSSSGVAAGHVVDNGSPPESSSTLAASAVSETSEPPLSVWEFPHIRRNGVAKADQTWTCLWCNLTFKHWNATKVLYHLSKISGHDVRVCKVAHDKKSKELYNSMVKDRNNSTAGMKERAANLVALVGEGQQSLATMFEAGRHRVTNGGGTTLATAGGTVAVATNRQRVFASEVTVEACTSSHLTMAIADFVHSTGLPFSATQGIYFQNILKLARGVPSTYKAPARNAIATTLLKINYNRRIEK